MSLSMRRLLLLVAFPVTVFAQFGEKVEVNYVEIPVTVLDRSNRPVRNLTRGNFEIYDEGEKQIVESFDAIDFASAEMRTAVSPLHPAARRNFLLLFDLAFSSPSSLGRAQEAARDFVARSVGRRDLVGVATVDADHGFRFLTAFTTDRVLLDAAIKDPRSFRALDPLQLAGTAANVLSDLSFAGDASGRNERRGDAGAETIADLKRAMRAADDAYRRSRVVRQVDTLGSLARSMQKLAGRKHVVLLSEGFDARLVQGRSASETLEQDEENAAIASGEVWKVDSDRRYGHSGAQLSVRTMAEEFRRADVVLHALDIQGLRVQNDTSAGKRLSSNEGLFLLAGATGGEVFRNSNDIRADFDRLVRQQEVVYVLGFRSQAGKPGQFRNLRVKVNGVPGARVSHRGGYYGTGSETTVERSLSTAEIIVNDIPENDLNVDALAAAFPSFTGNAQVPVILEIAGRDLIASAKNAIATTDIFVYAFDDGGVVRDMIHERVHFDTSKAGERLREAGAKFYGTLYLPAGKYAVKTLVRVAESDRKSFRRLDVDVPSAGDVAVSQPLFFAEEGKWVMVKASSRARKEAYPFVLDGESFVPAARATVRDGESRPFTVWVWNAEADELTWETAPAATLVSETRVAGSEMTKLVFALERVPAGTRELTVTIRKKGSVDERRVSVPISVQ